MTIFWKAPALDFVFAKVALPLGLSFSKHFLIIDHIYVSLLQGQVADTCVKKAMRPSL